MCERADSARPGRDRGGKTGRRPPVRKLQREGEGPMKVEYRKERGKFSVAEQESVGLGERTEASSESALSC